MRRTNALGMSEFGFFCSVVHWVWGSAIIICHVSYVPLWPAHSLCSWSHCGHLHGNMSSLVCFCRAMTQKHFFIHPQYLMVNNTAINASSEFFSPFLINLFSINSLHPWVLISFKYNMRIFYFNRFYSFSCVWGGTLSLSLGHSPLLSDSKGESYRMWAEKLCVFSIVISCWESRKSGLPVSLTLTPIQNIITVRVKESSNKKEWETSGNEDEKEPVKYQWCQIVCGCLLWKPSNTLISTELN